MKNSETLQRLGLSNNEIRVYDSLFDLGRSTTGPIIQRTGIANSRVYASLASLVARGLVSYQVKNNVRHYQAELPEHLLENIERDREELIALSQSLRKRVVQKKERNETSVYEGRYGFKKAFLKHIEECERGEMISFIGYSSRTTVTSRELREFFKGLDKIQVHKKMKSRFLLDRGIYNAVMRDKAKVPGYEYRYLPTGYFNPASINISKREVMLSVWGKSPMVMVIHNPVVRESFAQNFEYLWRTAKS